MWTIWLVNWSGSGGGCPILVNSCRGQVGSNSGVPGPETHRRATRTWARVNAVGRCSGVALFDGVLVQWGGGGADEPIDGVVMAVVVFCRCPAMGAH